jgi:hypothetical protein
MPECQNIKQKPPYNYNELINIFNEKAANLRLFYFVRKYIYRAGKSSATDHRSRLSLAFAVS